MTVKERYEALATQYFETNDPRHLLKDWALATAMWWTTSRGAKHDGISDSWQNYLAACTSSLPNFSASSYIDERDYCKQCGERYKVDNMSMCTNCFDGYCWRCLGGLERHPNGNPACRCGGELVG